MSTSDMHEMMHQQKGVNWATDYSDGEKNGRLIVKENYEVIFGQEQYKRTRWVSKGAWKFTEDKDKLLAMIPKYEN